MEIKVEIVVAFQKVFAEEIVKREDLWVTSKEWNKKNKV